MNIYDRLKKDHDTVKLLFQKLMQTEDRELSEREKLFSELKREIIAHNKAEEATFYASLMNGRRENNMPLLESTEEHRVAEALLEELDALPKDGTHWLPKLATLKEIIEHHIEEEESELFQKARQVFDVNTAHKVAEKFKLAKADLSAAELAHTYNVTTSV